MICHRSYTGRRAISPIIATVLIIATTVVASVAVSGVVYGIFQSSGTVAEVGIVGTYVPAAVTLGIIYVICAPATGNSFAGYLQLYNSGTAATVANSISFVYGGDTVVVQLGGSCKIAPDSGLYLVIYSLPYIAKTGVPYQGYVSTSNGADVLYSGEFD